VTLWEKPAALLRQAGFFVVSLKNGSMGVQLQDLEMGVLNG